MFFVAQKLQPMTPLVSFVWGCLEEAASDPTNIVIIWHDPDFEPDGTFAMGMAELGFA